MTGKESLSTTNHCSTVKWVNLKIICRGRERVIKQVRMLFDCYTLATLYSLTLTKQLNWTELNWTEFNWIEFNEIEMCDLRAVGQRRWSWNGGRRTGSWQPAASHCSMGACAAETGSQTSWRRRTATEPMLEPHIKDHTSWGQLDWEPTRAVLRLAVKENHNGNSWGQHPSQQKNLE